MSVSSDCEYDVIVAGGGPAGSTAATFIAMKGHRVLLLERQKSPGYKIGESLLPSTVHGICPMLGVSQELKDANFVIKSGGMFQWGESSEPWAFQFSTSSKTAGPTSTAYQVERMKFDRILLDNAKRKGVDVRAGATVKSAILDNDRVTGLTYTDEAGASRACSARFILDALGAESQLARFAGKRVYSDFFRNIALFGYYTGGGRLASPYQGNILCVAFEFGWFWYIPLSETLTSVGAVIGKEHAKKLTGGYENAMAEFIKACPRIRDLLSMASRVTVGPYGELRLKKDYSYCNSKFWIPGLALIGDSACFIDPIFSSGVHLATYSALLAARSINTILNGNLDEHRCFTEFEFRYRREFALFHDFLLAFYDANKTKGSSFWDTRKSQNSAEIANEPFISLVAGLGASGESMYASRADYLKTSGGLGDIIFPQNNKQAASDPAVHKKTMAFYKEFMTELTQLQLQALFKEGRPLENPLVNNGLVPSRDGLTWMESGELLH